MEENIQNQILAYRGILCDLTYGTFEDLENLSRIAEEIKDFAKKANLHIMLTHQNSAVFKTLEKLNRNTTKEEKEAKFKQARNELRALLMYALKP